MRPRAASHVINIATFLMMDSFRVDARSETAIALVTVRTVDKLRGYKLVDWKFVVVVRLWWAPCKRQQVCAFSKMMIHISSRTL